MALDDITIPIDNIVKNGLSINEYLLLYNISNSFTISGLVDSSLESMVKLENKGFIKIVKGEIYLREKSSVFFVVNDDLFSEWLKKYPTSVKKKYGGQRALSPASKNTILGKTLEKKWNKIFKKNITEQNKAIKVLELEVRDKTKSGDLEYMVEASRWLNEGYHEKYSYLLEQDTGTNKYENEDYL
jgi:hypothetical protein